MTAPTADDLAFVSTAWRLGSEPQLYRQVENFIYEATLDARPVIVRLTPRSQRRLDEVLSELDWIDYLGSSGLRVARPIVSGDGTFARRTHDEEFTAAVFERALGRSVDGHDDFTDDNLRTWGRYLGTMHRLTRDYDPRSVVRREEWTKDRGLRIARMSLSPEDGAPFTKFSTLLDWAEKLPQTRESYGLVHNDLHHGNFYIDDRGLVAFDFDDACYHWFAYDLTAPLVAMIATGGEEGAPLRLEEILPPFLSGYREESLLAPEWEARLPAFFQLRAAVSLYWIKTKLRAGELDAYRDWCDRRIAWCLDQLQKSITFV